MPERRGGEFLRTPWGLARSKLYLNGVEVPPRGSLKDRLIRVMADRELVLEVRKAEISGLMYAIWSSGAKYEEKVKASAELRQSLAQGGAHDIFTPDYVKQQLRGTLRKTRTDLHKERAMRKIGELPTEEAVRYYFEGLPELEAEKVPVEELVQAQNDIAEALALLGG